MRSAVALLPPPAQQQHERGRERHEHDDLAERRREAGGVALRQELGERFERFVGEHPGARGLSGEDKDPDRYVAENG